MSDALLACLSDAQHRGFIGPGNLAPHVAHARGFQAALGAQRSPTSVLDLGSGGGLPSLILAELWATARFWLVEAQQKRVDFLTEAAEALGWAGRVEILHGRAEEFGHVAELRASVDVVTARGFGPPAVTAECGSPFLAEGGRLVVSEPPRDTDPDDSTRWPGPGLAILGLIRVVPATEGLANYAVLRQDQLCPERYPRRVGIPAKRPLF